MTVIGECECNGCGRGIREKQGTGAEGILASPKRDLIIIARRSCKLSVVADGEMMGRSAMTHLSDLRPIGVMEFGDRIELVRRKKERTVRRDGPK